MKKSRRRSSTLLEMQIDASFKQRRDIFVLAFLFMTGFLFYYPMLNKYFASDDFAVLYRVVYEHGIFIKGFFRPLSDITLYFNYMMGGFDPAYYNVFSFLIHVCTVFMFYKLCRSSRWVSKENNFYFAFIAAIYFMLYPYHNEPVVWVVGRASLMASFFGIASLLVTTQDIKTPWKIFFSCLFYYIGLSGYESIMPLPFLLLILFAGRENWNLYFKIFAWLMLTLVVHLVTRLLVSDVILGTYGEGVFAPGIAYYFERFLKVLGRCFIPPLEDSTLAIRLFSVVMVLLVLAEILLFRHRVNDKRPFLIFNRMLIAFVVSLSVAFMFGVSTRTYEGDRLLYFPAFFLCMAIAYLVVSVTNQQSVRNAVTIVISCYFGWFLFQNNSNWTRAAAITTGIINELKQSGKNVVKLVVNLPEEYHGAYIFRNGFREALLLNQVDTSRIQVVNFIKTEDMNTSPRTFRAHIVGDSIHLPPYTTIVRKRTGIGYEILSKDLRYHRSDPGMVYIYYWNKETLQQIKW